MNILTIGLGRHILRGESNDRHRMRLYACHLDSFHIIVLTRRVHGYAESVHEGNLHIYPTHSLTRLGMLVDAFRIGQKILKTEQKKSFVISAQDPFEIGFIAYLLAKFSGVRFHLQLHGDYFDSLWRGKSFIRQTRLFVAQFLFTHACGIRVASERIKKSLLRRHVPESKITVLPIRPMLEDFDKERRTHIEGSFSCITVSRLAPEKNIPLMLRAFASCAKKYPYIQLKIVGDGEEQKKIRTCISELGLERMVTMIPWSDDIPSHMGSADVFLLASDHEAYGLVLVEALAAGLPVVTTDVGCVGEVIYDGVHGFVVPPRDEKSFAIALEKMILDQQLKRKMGEAGKTTARELQIISEELFAKAWVATHSCSERGL